MPWIFHLRMEIFLCFASLISWIGKVAQNLFALKIPANAKELLPVIYKPKHWKKARVIFFVIFENKFIHFIQKIKLVEIILKHPLWTLLILNLILIISENQLFSNDTKIYKKFFEAKHDFYFALLSTKITSF